MPLKPVICFWVLLCSSIKTFSQTPDYNNNIQAVIQSHCMPCHTKAGVGAMPLTNYREVSAYGAMIGYVTENKLMPPWKADGEFSRLKNHNTLTEKEIEIIRNWVTTGMPEGEKPAQQMPVAAKENKEKQVACLTGAMTQTFEVPGDYVSLSQVFVIPIGNTKDEYISALEFVPGNKKIIKSCTLSIDTGRTGIQYDANDNNYGYGSPTALGFIPSQYNVYQWTPEQKTGLDILPAPVKIPAGSNLLLHMNYAAGTITQKDSSYVKLHCIKLTDSTAVLRSEILFDTANLTNGPFNINKGDKRKFYATREVKKDIEIYGIMPMGQFALSSWEIYAIDNISGQRINLLKIPHWDAHWKKKYMLEKPVTLTTGSIIYGVAYYNNGSDNPNLIILPPKKIKYGEGQRDELFLVQYDFKFKQ